MRNRVVRWHRIRLRNMAGRITKVMKYDAVRRELWVGGLRAAENEMLDVARKCFGLRPDGKNGVAREKPACRGQRVWLVWVGVDEESWGTGAMKVELTAGGERVRSFRRMMR